MPAVISSIKLKSRLSDAPHCKNHPTSPIPHKASDIPTPIFAKAPPTWRARFDFVHATRDSMLPNPGKLFISSKFSTAFISSIVFVSAVVISVCAALLYASIPD